MRKLEISGYVERMKQHASYRHVRGHHAMFVPVNIRGHVDELHISDNGETYDFCGKLRHAEIAASKKISKRYCLKGV